LAAARGWKEHADQGAQKPLQPAQEETEVVAGSGEHGVAAIAVASFEVIDLPPEKWTPGYAYFASACCGVM
jgi:hypothetical protein